MQQQGVGNDQYSQYQQQQQYAMSPDQTAGQQQQYNMQQQGIGNDQYSQYQQQQQYAMSPDQTAGQQQQYDMQQQYGQSMPPPGQQNISHQSNTVQIPNQLGSQQPIVITQTGKKKDKTAQNVLNAILVTLAVILIVGLIVLTIIQSKQTKEQMDAKKAADEAAKQNENTDPTKNNSVDEEKTAQDQQPQNNLQSKTSDVSPYANDQKQNVNNDGADVSLNSVNQSQGQSASVGG